MCCPVTIAEVISAGEFTQILDQCEVPTNVRTFLLEVGITCVPMFAYCVVSGSVGKPLCRSLSLSLSLSLSSLECSGRFYLLFANRFEAELQTDIITGAGDHLSCASGGGVCPGGMSLLYGDNIDLPQAQQIGGRIGRDNGVCQKMRFVGAVSRRGN